MDPKSQEPTRDSPERDFLYTNYSKGPQAKGDPEDRSLRQVEKDLSIGKMRRNYAYEICDPIVKKFLGCAEVGYMNMVFGRKCKAEKQEMNHCLEQAFKSKENKRVVTEQYLAMRKLYRETGLNAHTRKKMQDNGLWEPFLEELEKIKSDETRATSQ